MEIAKTKVCKLCKEEKVITEFYNPKYYACRDCSVQYARNKRKEDKRLKLIAEHLKRDNPMLFKELANKVEKYV